MRCIIVQALTTWLCLYLDIYCKTPRCKFKGISHNLQPRDGLHHSNFLGQARSLRHCMDLACHSPLHKTVHFSAGKCYGLNCNSKEECGFFKSENASLVAYLQTTKGKNKPTSHPSEKGKVLGTYWHSVLGSLSKNSPAMVMSICLASLSGIKQWTKNQIYFTFTSWYMWGCTDI